VNRDKEAAVVSIFKKLFKNDRSKDFITVVSGLPRSGTSMMMRMLEAGGMEIVTDNIRRADDDNPRGYFEYERVKKLKEDASCLDICHGKAVKIISMLLLDLPPDKRYRVIFMRREMQETLSSQRVMLQRLGKKEDDISDEKMAEKFEKHLRQVEAWIDKQDYLDVLYLKYSEVIEDSQKYAERVNQFLGKDLNVAKMVGVIEKSLYRQRVQ
jgi:hypothetical protein